MNNSKNIGSNKSYIDKVKNFLIIKYFTFIKNISFYYFLAAMNEQEDEEYVPEEAHIRHCMLYEFRRGCRATNATKNICTVYGNILDVRKCQRWFNKFRSGDVDLTDGHRPGRPVELKNDILRSAVENDPKQTIRQLADKLNSSWSSVQEHLHQIGKVNRDGVWIDKEDIKIEDPQTSKKIKLEK